MRMDVATKAKPPSSIKEHYIKHIQKDIQINNTIEIWNEIRNETESKNLSETNS